MTTLISLTPYPSSLDYELDQNSNYPSKYEKVLAQQICLEISG
jgi:hypothetical protein